MSYLVFVYGTLKTNFPNYKKNQGILVPGSFQTFEKFPLYLIGDRFSPCLFDLKREGENVKGELFKHDKQSLEILDQLERVYEKDGYIRREIKIKNLSSGNLCNALCYFKSITQLHSTKIQKGPLKEYGQEDAKFYIRRNALT